MKDPQWRETTAQCKCCGMPIRQMAETEFCGSRCRLGRCGHSKKRKGKR